MEVTWCLRHTSSGRCGAPIGKRNGGLSGVHPVDLAAHVLRELIARTGVDPSAVEDVIMGCVSQVGPQSIDIARNAWLSAGLPESVPGVTIDRQCGSSQQAVHFAAQGVLSGTQDLVDRGRRREHEHGARWAPRSPCRMKEGMAPPVRPGLAGPVRQPGDLPVPRRPADVREVGHQARPARGVRATRATPARHPGDRRGPVRPRDHPRRPASPPTRARAATPRWRRWPSSSRCARAGN